MKVSISFADEDYLFAEKIITGLIEKGVSVVSNSNSIDNEIQNWGKDFFTLVNEQFSGEIDYCIVLLTKNYQKSKWNDYTRCILLETAFTRRNFILPVKVGENIPNLTGLNLIKYIKVQEGDFQFVIDAFLSKASVASEGVNYLRGYTDIESILNLYDPKSLWQKISGEKDLDNEKGIGFDLFLNKNRLFNSINCYVIYLYEGITTKNTIEYLKQKYSHIFTGKLLVLMPYERKQKEFDKRKSNISNGFNSKEIYYIKEFIWEHCTPKDFTENKSLIPLQNFVTPYIENDSKEKFKADEFVINWLNQFDDPILVLSGTGGIGKTTLAKWIVNYVYNNKPNTRALFIESAEITTYLLRGLDIANELDLYKFYEADYEERLAKNQVTGKKLDNVEFKCNLDNGNILIIIDGLDEVITRLGDLFDINSFISSIYKFTSNIGNGKVIITTRNYFWDKYNKLSGSKIQSVEVCPFDLDLTKEYFNTYFNSNQKFVEKAIEIATDWMPDKSKKQYIPFVLDLITYIVESRYDSDIIQDSLFESEILQPQIYNDYLLYKVCERELIKLDNILTVDLQIQLFINISTTYNSKISEKQLIKELSDLTRSNYTNKTLESFKSHPIIKWLSETKELIFKYDFFEEHFKNIYLGLLINSKIEFNNKLVEILADFNNYNSFFQNTLVKRITNFNEEIKFQILHIIEQIQNSNVELIGITREIKNRALSSVFIFTLKSFTNNITKNTELLLEFFMSNNIINNMSIINCHSINSPKIIFDFSGLTLRNCTFQNYEYFGQCKFDDKTLFEYCKFEKLSLNQKLDYPFKPHNFKHPDADNNFKDTLRSKSIEKGNTKREIIDDVKDFLKSFYTRGQIITLSPELLRKRYSYKVVPYKNMVDIFEKEGVCHQYVSPKREDKFEINENYHESIIQFITNGKNSVKLENILQILIQKYK